MKPAPMKTAKYEHWSAELIRIGNLAVRQAQTRNRQLGIPNWYSLNGRLVSDVQQPVTHWTSIPGSMPCSKP